LIKFEYSKYTIQPVHQIGAVATDAPRAGALLKCTWPDGKVGISDIHPWAELGDADIDTQLNALARGKISFLVEQSIWLARKDAILRAMMKNGLEGATKFKNHFLITDLSKITDQNLNEIKSSGFTTLKIKVGPKPMEDAERSLKILRSGNFQVRFDFGSKLDFSEYERFLTILDKPAKARIDYMEDPFPYDNKSWMEASRLATLAADEQYENVDWSKVKELPFKIIVIKPARQDVDKAIHRAKTYNLKMVVTSSLDHPVGVIHSALVASEIKKEFPNQLLDCGCLSIKSYRPNEFSTKIMTQGPYFTQVNGYGIGFDQVIEGLTWTEIKSDW
jgi:O-succinylbenzoate synthase